ncbi:unnamed protein product [Phaedon cochleariae]|uniref:Zinc finger protein n=1 Tax=Phaedon cochleariae TaxID=80249 RepID=A0A9N9SAT9_PHACE|nr:unnamed protein product [Phaedon cochleariae]
MYPEISTLNEACRACLRKQKNMKQLPNYNDDTHELTKKIASLLHLQVTKIQTSSYYPCYLCGECEEKLDISFKFQQLCQQSHEFIIAYVGKLNTVIFKSNEDKGSEIPKEPYTHVIVEEQLCDTNDLEILGDSVANNKANNFNSIQTAEEVMKFSNKQVMRLSQYPQEEVNSVIKMIREKLSKQQNCLYCNFTAKGSRSLSFHMSRLHQGYKEKWCSKCNKSVEILSEHWKDEHEDEFKCCFCERNFDNTSHLLEHLACHTVDRKFRCEICQKCFISARHLRAHTKVHSPEKKYACLVCSKSVRTKQSLITHLKSHKKHKCKVCEDIFDPLNYESHKCFPKTESAAREIDSRTSAETIRKADTENSFLKNEKDGDSLDKLNLKNRNVENTEMKALCVYCGKKFRTPSKLSVHMRLHTGETPYQCSYCDARMTTRSHLVVHERTHTGEKPYVCNICSKGFAQSSVLGTHKKIHTGRTEQCSLCSKKFCRPSELKQHMRKHTGEKPFLCEYCDKAFVQRSHLVEHHWTHTDERRFKCEFCEKGFKQAGTLKSHLNIHLGKKPYQCSKCTYTSRQSYSLQQHMLQHEEPKEEISYRCEICDLTFLNMALFTSHCSNTHEVITTFSSDETLEIVQDDTTNNQQSEILQLLY